MIILDHVYTRDDVLAINDFLNGFVKGADQFDDITMMAFRYFGPDNK